MELSYLLRIVWMWRRLILLLVVVTATVLFLRVRVTGTVYEAYVRLQMTAPQQEDVALFGGFGSYNLRDEVTVARNNFTDILTGRAVRNQTVQDLGLRDGDEEYAVEVRPVPESDFLVVTIRASTPTQASEIANAHVANAIAYYGQIRAKPAAAAKNIISVQLKQANQDLQEAQAAFTDFQIKNQAAGLEQKIAAAAAADAENPSPARQEELNRLVSLQATYLSLQQSVEQKRAALKLLEDKYNEALLKESAVQNASFIQVIEAARPPTEPAATNLVPLLVLAVVGSLGFGVMLALVIEAVLGYSPARLRTRP